MARERTGPDLRQQDMCEGPRVPFAVEKETQAELIEFSRVVSVDEINRPKSLVREALYYIYDRFGWGPAETLLDSEIERLYAPHRGYS